MDEDAMLVYDQLALEFAWFHQPLHHWDVFLGIYLNARLEALARHQGLAFGPCSPTWEEAHSGALSPFGESLKPWL